MSAPYPFNSNMRGTEFPIAADGRGRVRSGVINIDGISLTLYVHAMCEGKKGLYWPLELSYPKGTNKVLKAVDIQE